MADGRRNVLLAIDWKRGIDNLKELGCGFIAFYGAEPLEEFAKLPTVVGYAEKVGIHTTVITSGVTDNFFQKLGSLRRKGAKSLSMSFDMVELDKFSRTKMMRALNGLKYFRSFGSIRDVAAIATLNRKNYEALPDMVRDFTKEGIWTFFDLIHADRGQPGTKCKNYPGIDELLFGPDDILGLVKVFRELLELKNQGYLCHTSSQFIGRLVQNGGELLFKYNWNCANEDNFPAWVTVDCTGIVQPCDDFFIPGVLDLNVMDLAKNWKKFCKTWKPVVQEKCPGCAWNTHFDAHLIKRGELPFSDYVHTKGESGQG
jgi:hypothetical protein